jgi:hypothetical protein
MNTLWTVLVPLAQQTPEPEDVKAGWIAFGLFLLLVAAVVFLWFSMRKQLRKVNFEEKDGNGAPNGTGSAPR